MEIAECGCLCCISDAYTSFVEQDKKNTNRTNQNRNRHQTFLDEAFEKPNLLSTRRRANVFLERSEESAWHVMPFFSWKRLGM